MQRVRLICFLILFFPSSKVVAQYGHTEKLVLITLDGFRWQELFLGADPDFATNLTDSAAIRPFLRESPDRAREVLLPFIWNTVAQNGQLYGNRLQGNKVNCRNNRLISYPGYSEMLVGFSSMRIFSNRKILNPYVTVLEKLRHEHNADVAAFATWDAFSFILHEDRSGIFVRAGDKHGLEGKIKAGSGPDSLTFQNAMAYLKAHRPDVLMIAFDGTDHYAHRGDYAGYLQSAHAIDRWMNALWEWLQAQPDYRGKTTLLITTDHGRGFKPDTWAKHRLFIRGSRHVWLGVMGPDTPPLGEMSEKSRLYLDQTAGTLGAFLGYPYSNVRKVGSVVTSMFFTSAASASTRE